MKSFQRRWKGLEITIVAVLVLLLLLLAYLNWAIAILALIIVVAAYLVNYNTLHNRRRLAREQFSAMMKNVTQASNFALQNLPMGIVLVNKQGTLVWNNSVFADWVKVDWNKLQKMSALLPGFRIDKIWGKSGYMTEKYENRYFQIIYKFIDPRDTRSDIDSEDELAEHAVMALYFAISRGALHEMEEDGFKVLERIRKVPSPRQVPATISIGISENVGSVKDVSGRARAALDIA